MFDFLKEVIDLFSKSGIQYMISGSIAFNLYAIPRSTRNIDIVAGIELNDIDKFVSLVRDNYYYTLPAIKDAIDRKSMLNIIHLKSGYKLDVIVLSNQPYEVFKFNRRRTSSFENIKFDVITPEDLVISKLMWIQNLESELQKRDIMQMSPQQRFKMGLEMADEGMKLMKAGILAEKGNLSEEDLRIEVIRRLKKYDPSLSWLNEIFAGNKSQLING